jgi:membrane protein required for colicin V production
MVLLDIVVFLLIGGFGVRGFLSGFVKESLSIGAIIAGILAVRFLHATVTVFLTGYVSNEYVAALLAFVLLFGTVYIAGKMLANAVGNRSRSSVLGPFDRVLGLGFGAIKGLLIATVGFVGFSIVYDALYGDLAARPGWIRASRSYPLLNASGQAMSAWLAENSHEGGLLGGSGPEQKPSDDNKTDAEPTS